MSDVDDYDEYGAEPVAPLNSANKPMTMVADTSNPNNTSAALNRHQSDNSNITNATSYIGRPQYAASTKSFQSGVSSNIGATTYFDQMDIVGQNGDKQESKYNRVYAYFNLFDFLLQCALMVILIFNYLNTYDQCSENKGNPSSCKSNSECIYNASIDQCLPNENPYLFLLIIYVIILILSLFNLIYRSCLLCYVLRTGKRNKKLFIKGQVMHQIWMNRIADSCCMAFCCCKSNIAILAYFAAIDQNKAHPTNASFIALIIFKILNIGFCIVYIILYEEIDLIIIIICVCFIVTLIMLLNRMRLRRNAQFEKRRASITKNSINV